MGVVRVFTNWAMGRDPFLTKEALDERMKNVQKISYEGVERDVQKRHDSYFERPPILDEDLRRANNSNVPR